MCQQDPGSYSHQIAETLHADPHTCQNSGSTLKLHRLRQLPPLCRCCRRYADVVVHRQLLLALQLEQGRRQPLQNQHPPHPQLLLVPAEGQQVPLTAHAEVAAAADVMNERHRASKRAQKECSDLYLLLLLHR